MQYINPFGPRREIDHSESSGFVSHANFLDPGTDIRHRLPIVRIEPTLNPVQFIAQRILRGFRKPSYDLPPHTCPGRAWDMEAANRITKLHATISSAKSRGRE